MKGYATVFVTCNAAGAAKLPRHQGVVPFGFPGESSLDKLRQGHGACIGQS